MQERIKITIYWLIGAVAAIIVPYQYMLFLDGFMFGNDKMPANSPKFLLWIMGLLMLAISIAIICLAAYGFYRWMHWLLNGDKHTR